MKIQINFVCRKNFKSIFNENKDQFYIVVLLSFKNVFSSLLQISKFKEESNLKLRHVNQLLKIELSIWTVGVYALKSNLLACHK